MKLVRLADRQGAQNHRIHHAKDRRVRSDPQRQRDHRHQHNTGRAPKLPECIARVLDQHVNGLAKHSSSIWQQAGQERGFLLLIRSSNSAMVSSYGSQRLRGSSLWFSITNLPTYPITKFPSLRPIKRSGHRLLPLSIEPLPFFTAHRRLPALRLRPLPAQLFYAIEKSHGQAGSVRSTQTGRLLHCRKYNGTAEYVGLELHQEVIAHHP